MATTKSRNISRNRKKKLIKGGLLIPSAGVAAAYSQEIKSLIKQMTLDVLRRISGIPSLEEIKKNNRKDLSNTIKDIKESIAESERDNVILFSQRAFRIASRFISANDISSLKSSERVIKNTKLNANTLYSEQVRDELTKSIGYNARLISKIPVKYFNKLNKVIEESVTSEKLQKQGAKAIFDFVKEISSVNETRAKLIAEDQTKKIYSSLNIIRMKDNGLEVFRWVHSSGGKAPRKSHLERDGKLYLLKGDDWQLFNIDGTDANIGVPPSDIGKPGYAIHCRCRILVVRRISEV